MSRPLGKYIFLQLHFGAHGGSSAEANAIPPTSIENVDASSSSEDKVDARYRDHIKN